MKNYSTNFVIRLLLAAVLLGLTCYTADAGVVDCGSKPIRLGFFEFGLFYFVKDGKPQGIDKDVVAELAKRTGCKFETQVLPRARIWRDLENGELDMTTAAIQTPERDRYATFVPYLSTKNRVLLLARTTSGVHNADDFMAKKELQFGMIRGFKHEATLDQWLDKMRKEQRVQESAEPELMFEKLKLGRIDGIFSHAYVYRKILKDMNMEGIVVIQDWMPNGKGLIGNFMFSKRRFSGDDTDRWRSVMNGMRADGTLRNIFLRYMTTDDVKNSLDY